MLPPDRTVKQKTLSYLGENYAAKRETISRRKIANRRRVSIWENGAKRSLQAGRDRVGDTSTVGEPVQNGRADRILAAGAKSPL